MPEGDTVHKLARAMAPLLVGEPLAALHLRDRGEVRELAGARIEEVAALGKHLLVAIGPRVVLHVHLGMNGRWHRSRPGEVGPRPVSAASACIDTGSCRLAVFRAPVAELLRRGALAAHPALARLGPDLVADAVDLGVVVARARRRRAASVAELLLDQTVACGLGNVYKSEVPFLEGVDPRTPPEALDDARLAALYARGHALLRANLGGWRRTTTRAVRAGEPWPRDLPRLWVYGRAGAPCLRCGARIASRLLGDDARPTYWCPACQPRSGAVTGGREPERDAPDAGVAALRGSAPTPG